MAYELSKFGNGVDVGSGGNVTTSLGTPHNRFNTVNLGQQLGVFHSDNGVTEVTGTITGEQLVRDAATGDAFLNALSIPVGAVIAEIIVQVKQAFVLGGTTPTILIGTQGSEVTNGFVISQAQAQAIGTYVVTGTKAGTWNAPIAAAAVVGVALGGTTPTVTSAGILDFYVKYTKA